MTLEELNQIATAEGLDPSKLNLVVAFAGGDAALDLSPVDADEVETLGYDPATTMLMTLLPRVAKSSDDVPSERVEALAIDAAATYLRLEADPPADFDIDGVDVAVDSVVDPSDDAAGLNDVDLSDLKSRVHHRLHLLFPNLDDAAAARFDATLKAERGGN